MMHVGSRTLGNARIYFDMERSENMLRFTQMWNVWNALRFTKVCM